MEDISIRTHVEKRPMIGRGKDKRIPEGPRGGETIGVLSESRGLEASSRLSWIEGVEAEGSTFDGVFLA